MEMKLGPEPVLAKNIAFVFDAAGLYCGIQKMQESPLEPGTFLLPRNACLIKPIFKEGFIPKWNGESWDLVERKVAIKDSASFASEMAKAQQLAFDNLARNASTVVGVEIDRRWSEIAQLIDLELKGFRLEVKGMVDSLLAQVEERALETLRERLKKDLEAELSSIVQQRAELMGEVTEARKLMHEVEKLRDLPKEKSFISKLFS